MLVAQSRLESSSTCGNFLHSLMFHPQAAFIFRFLARREPNTNERKMRVSCLAQFLLTSVISPSLFAGAAQQARRRPRRRGGPEAVPRPLGHPEANDRCLAGGQLAEGQRRVSSCWLFHLS